VWRRAGGGGGEGGARDTESKTRTPHKDVGKNPWKKSRSLPRRDPAGSGRCGLATAATWHTMSIAASGGVPWSGDPGDRDFWGSVDPWSHGAPGRLSHRIVNTCHGLIMVYGGYTLW